jgi:hypothetical protein
MSPSLHFIGWCYSQQQGLRGSSSTQPGKLSWYRCYLPHLLQNPHISITVFLIWPQYCLQCVSFMCVCVSVCLLLITWNVFPWKEPVESDLLRIFTRNIQFVHHFAICTHSIMLFEDTFLRICVYCVSLDTNDLCLENLAELCHQKIILKLLRVNGCGLYSWWKDTVSECKNFMEED